MSEIEVPTEQLHETIQEEAHKAKGGGHGGEGPSWVMPVALSSAIIAVLAAIAALLAGHFANEAMLEQMKATDGWGYYQAKGIKANVLQTKIEIVAALGKPVGDEDPKKLVEYQNEQKEIEHKAKEEEHASELHMKQHSTLAKSVTVFQIAIALSAIAVLTRKKFIWFGSMALGLGGAAFLALALL